MRVNELFKIAEQHNVEVHPRERAQDIIFSILRAAAKRGDHVFASGVLEKLQDGYGFLRTDDNFQPGPDDIYVSPRHIRQHSLKTGDTVSGKIRPPRESERYFALLQINELNMTKPEEVKGKVDMDDLTPLFPEEWLRLERGNGSTEDISSRIIDLVAPIGKGQRGLIVAPPKAGKTMMLQNIAQSISAKNPECKLIVLLIDERPEEVTEMQRSVKAEVIASTFDESASRHVQVAEMVIAKAKRLVEQKHDVVIILDSITRLARLQHDNTDFWSSTYRWC